MLYYLKWLFKSCICFYFKGKEKQIKCSKHKTSGKESRKESTKMEDLYVCEDQETMTKPNNVTFIIRNTEIPTPPAIHIWVPNIWSILHYLSTERAQRQKSCSVPKCERHSILNGIFLWNALVLNLNSWCWEFRREPHQIPD